MKNKVIIIICAIVVVICAIVYCSNYAINDDSPSEEKTTSSYESYEEKENDDDDDISDELAIDIYAPDNHYATLNDDVGFPLPSLDLLNSYQREGDSIIYDMQDNGKGVLINAYGIGMQKVIGTIFVTSNRGKNWQIVEKEVYFSTGSLDVVYIGDTIAIINTSFAAMTTAIYISNDNGKTFDLNSNNITTFADVIGESSDTNITVFPVFLSKDYEKKTILCAWCSTSYDSNEVLLISEHYIPTFEITKEYYRNKTAIENNIDNF